MKKYLARLVFQVTIDGAHNHFDEQLRLFGGFSPENAFELARQRGRREEQTFLNNSGEMVCWQFVDVLDLVDLENIADEEIVFSFSNPETECQSYKQYVRTKAIGIKAKNPTFV